MKLNDIKVGSCVVMDGGFSCMEAGPHVVHQDEDGLYVVCRNGHHYLYGQEDEEDGELVGVRYLDSLIILP